MTAYKKKLIEVALPLDAINRESSREKSIRHGHPSSLHLWWSRKPLSTCRAVLFASLVDDPSARADEFPTQEAQDAERRRLFDIIEQLVKWENSNEEKVLASAHAEIMRSTDGNPPPVLDPFCGGGSIPLEAQRLGLEALANDLNPVAVLITKALIEIPPQFANMPPVNPEARGKLDNTGWHGAQGLADDVRYYGHWMREQAMQRVGHLYPKAALSKEQGGGEATVIAWLWLRTLTCPNPACGAEMPLTSKWSLSTKKGQQVWVQPIADAESRSVRFEIRTGFGLAPAGTVNDKGATCLVCGTHVPLAHIRAEGQAGRIGKRQLARVVQLRSKRGFVAATSDDGGGTNIESVGALDLPLPARALGFSVQNYGATTHADLYTERSAATLSTMARLVTEARDRVRQDTSVEGGTRSTEPDMYADAVSTYLGLAVSRLSTVLTTLSRWTPVRAQVLGASMQTVSYVWDFPEVNPFSGGAGDLDVSVGSVVKALRDLPAVGEASVRQLDAAQVSYPPGSACVSTDPPYYDNIGYANLSDLSYVWLRAALGQVHPDLMSTVLTPKEQEIIAEPGRHGGNRQEAKTFFETSLLRTFRALHDVQSREVPLTVYYAFKQTESGSATDAPGGWASSGWETMLSALLEAGFLITGTWPMRTERPNRSRSQDSNALASSVVLVCRPRAADAALATRKEYIATLRAELPEALVRLQHGNIAPVDLAQASIGPGMAAFSRYSKVIEADGSQMSVRTALALINQALDEILAEQEGEFDADTRWAIAWFEQFGINAGEFGDAETLSKAKGTSVEGMVQAGILEAKGGKVRLLRRDELADGWDPATDKRLTVWEMTQHLIRRVDESEDAAAALARQLGSFAEVARDLAYRLYLVCERKKWSQEGQAYNGLVVSWPHVMQRAASQPAPAAGSQTSMEL
jgi:putative DNA methylase